MSDKRSGYITWDEYFMGVAKLSAMRSKDPNTQVGCCIVSEDNKILSMGYNGFPLGCEDDEYPWGREGSFGETKYPYVTHSADGIFTTEEHEVAALQVFNTINLRIYLWKRNKRFRSCYKINQ